VVRRSRSGPGHPLGAVLGGRARDQAGRTLALRKRGPKP